ncbi:MAG: YceI family protein [Opitutaceae bacterium]
MKTRTLLALFLALTVARVLPGRELIIDEDRSYIRFAVAATGHHVEGHVISFQAEIDLDSGQDFPRSATLRFAARQLTTEHEERDAEMYKWLEVDKYPNVIFKMDALEGRGSTRVAHGSLTFHGVTRSIDIPVTLSSVGPVITLTGETEVNTRSFRLSQFRRALVMTVSEDVAITFTLVGRLE